MITFHVITLFPESLESYLNASIVRRAGERGLISVKCYNPRDFVAVPKGKKADKLSFADRRVDKRPYGGGPGMVIEALPILKAIDKAVGKKLAKAASAKKVKILFFSPAGEQFSNAAADSFKTLTDIVLICGRYEGIDARVNQAFKTMPVSVGPYTLTGGELPAMIVIDTVSRRIPGVLGDDLSIEESRIASSDVYTRPEVLEFKGKKYKVPKVLLGGNHALIDEWKLKGKKGK
ncbi:MAG: trmD [Candidatus Parcubacteria bacterium]|nr:trmD [Candidatus Parcubacteria bacterium]